MLYTKNFSYVLIIILLVVFGPLHPPTANDRTSLGMPRAILGWLTLAFILIGFTTQPIRVVDPETTPKPRTQQPGTDVVQVQTRSDEGTVDSARRIAAKQNQFRADAGRPFGPVPPKHAGSTHIQ
jgi:hypothetical protein